MKPFAKPRPWVVFVAFVPVVALLVALFYVASLRPREIPLPVSNNGALVLSPDGQWLLYWNAAEDGVRLRNLGNLAARSEQEFPTQGWASFCFSPDSRSFAVLSQKGRDSTGAPLAQVEWRDTTSGQLRQRFSGVVYSDNAYLRGRMVRFTSDSKALLAVGVEGVKELVLGSSRSPLVSFPRSESAEVVAWSEKYWVLQYDRDLKNHFLEIYDAQTGKLVRSLKLKRDYIQKAQLSPDSNFLALRDAQGVAGTPANNEGDYILEISTGKRLWDFYTPDFLFLPDSKSLVTQNNDGGMQKLTRYEARKGRRLNHLRAPAVKLNVADGAFTPDGKNLYVVESNGSRGTLWKIRVD